ncbi:hypothetical protein [Streptomyces sp. Da 82-17]|uniref:hypothetical protein n=1 Tax=Streptomyces sp. Da 82-17 TaxID=3377116 RepID=UPI0038D436E9
MSADWSNDTVTLNHPVLVAEIENAYAELDYIALFATVLDHRQVNLPVALAALDEVLSDVPYVTGADESEDDA